MQEDLNSISSSIVSNNFEEDDATHYDQTSAFSSAHSSPQILNSPQTKSPSMVQALLQKFSEKDIVIHPSTPPQTRLQNEEFLQRKALLSQTLANKSITVHPSSPPPKLQQLEEEEIMPGTQQPIQKRKMKLKRSRMKKSFDSHTIKETTCQFLSIQPPPLVQEEQHSNTQSTVQYSSHPSAPPPTLSTNNKCPIEHLLLTMEWFESDTIMLEFSIQALYTYLQDNNQPHFWNIFFRHQGLVQCIRLFINYYATNPIISQTLMNIFVASLQQQYHFFLEEYILSPFYHSVTKWSLQNESLLGLQLWVYHLQNATTKLEMTKLEMQYLQQICFSQHQTIEQSFYCLSQITNTELLSMEIMVSMLLTLQHSQQSNLVVAYAMQCCEFYFYHCSNTAPLETLFLDTLVTMLQPQQTFFVVLHQNQVLWKRIFSILYHLFVTLHRIPLQQQYHQSLNYFYQLSLKQFPLDLLIVETVLFAWNQMIPTTTTTSTTTCTIFSAQQEDFFEEWIQQFLILQPNIVEEYSTRQTICVSLIHVLHYICSNTTTTTKKRMITIPCTMILQLVTPYSFVSTCVKEAIDLFLAMETIQEEDKVMEWILFLFSEQILYDTLFFLLYKLLPHTTLPLPISLLSLFIHSSIQNTTLTLVNLQSFLWIVKLKEEFVIECCVTKEGYLLKQILSHLFFQETIHVVLELITICLPFLSCSLIQICNQLIWKMILTCSINQSQEMEWICGIIWNWKDQIELEESQIQWVFTHLLPIAEKEWIHNNHKNSITQCMGVIYLIWKHHFSSALLYSDTIMTLICHTLENEMTCQCIALLLQKQQLEWITSHQVIPHLLTQVSKNRNPILLQCLQTISLIHASIPLLHEYHTMEYMIALLKESMEEAEIVILILNQLIQTSNKYKYQLLRQLSSSMIQQLYQVQSENVMVMSSISNLLEKRIVKLESQTILVKGKWKWKWNDNRCVSVTNREVKITSVRSGKVKCQWVWNRNCQVEAIHGGKQHVYCIKVSQQQKEIVILDYKTEEWREEWMEVLQYCIAQSQQEGETNVVEEQQVPPLTPRKRGLTGLLLNSHHSSILSSPRK